MIVDAPLIDMRALGAGRGAAGRLAVLQEIPRRLRLFDLGEPPIELATCLTEGPIVLAMAPAIDGSGQPELVVVGGRLIERIDMVGCVARQTYVVRDSEVRSVALSAREPGSRC